MDSHKYLIIGGSTKCGTTSIFNYFEYHPQVCPCVMKESRYFWTENYPLSAATKNTLNTRSFSDLFMNCTNDQLRIEATPDYLYSASSAVKIQQELQNCKLVFLLRHPVTRLVSWYKFAMLNGMIAQETSFEAYIQMQQKSPGENTPQHLRALEQGNYAVYLEPYINILGSTNILVSFYEDLVSNPAQFCGNIARFGGIDESYFDNFDFKVFNKTGSAKSVAAHQLFRSVKRSARPFTRLFHSSIRKKIKLAGHKLEVAYQAANMKTGSAEIRISTSLQQFLENYYREDRIQLQQLTGKQAPWENPEFK